LLHGCEQHGAMTAGVLPASRRLPLTPVPKKAEEPSAPERGYPEPGHKILGGRPGPWVTLHVYSTWCSPAAALAGLTVVHLGVELLDWEFCFTQVGVRAAKPGMYDSDRHVKAVQLGHSPLRCSQIKTALTMMSKTYTAEAYSLFGRNCQTFALELIKRLGIDTQAIPMRYFSFAGADRPELLCGEGACAQSAEGRRCPCCWEDAEGRSPTGCSRFSLHARPVLKDDCADSDCEGGTVLAGTPADKVNQRLDQAVLAHLRSAGG